MAILEPFHLVCVTGNDNKVDVINHELKEIASFRSTIFITGAIYLKSTGKIVLYSRNCNTIIVWDIKNNIKTKVKCNLSLNEDVSGILNAYVLKDDRFISCSHHIHIHFIFDLKKSLIYRLNINTPINNLIQLTDTKIAFNHDFYIYIYDLNTNDIITKLNSLSAIHELCIFAGWLVSVHYTNIKIWDTVTNNGSYIVLKHPYIKNGGESITPLILGNKIIYLLGTYSIIVCWEFDNINNIKLKENDFISLFGMMGERPMEDQPTIGCSEDPLLNDESGINIREFHNSYYGCSLFLLKAFKMDSPSSDYDELIMLSDGRILVCGSEGNFCPRIWDLKTKDFQEFPYQIKNVSHIKEIADNTIVAIGQYNGLSFIVFWKFDIGKIEMFEIIEHNRIESHILELINERFVYPSSSRNGGNNLFIYDRKENQTVIKNNLRNIKFAYKFHTTEDKSKFTTMLDLPKCIPNDLQLIISEYLLSTNEGVY